MLLKSSHDATEDEVTVGLFLCERARRDLILIDCPTDRFSWATFPRSIKRDPRAEFPHCLLEGFHVKGEGRILHDYAGINTSASRAAGRWIASITRHIVKKQRAQRQVEIESVTGHRSGFSCWIKQTVDNEMKKWDNIFSQLTCSNSDKHQLGLTDCSWSSEFTVLHRKVEYEEKEHI